MNKEGRRGMGYVTSFKLIRSACVCLPLLILPDLCDCPLKWRLIDLGRICWNCDDGDVKETRRRLGQPLKLDPSAWRPCCCCAGQDCRLAYQLLTNPLVDDAERR